jgi:hypothetical protein
MPTVGRRQPLGRSLTERAHASVLDSFEFLDHEKLTESENNNNNKDEENQRKNKSMGGDVDEDIHPREFEWIFSALYEAARAPQLGHAAPHALSNLGSMKLNIPETVLFESKQHNGKVVKWIGTGIDGRVVRRSLEHMTIDNDLQITNNMTFKHSSVPSMIVSASNGDIDNSNGTSTTQRRKRRNRGSSIDSRHVVDDDRDVVDIHRNVNDDTDRAYGDLSTSDIMNKIKEFFLSFANRNQYYSTSDIKDKEERPIAIVWYLDGQSEVLSEKMFKYVLMQQEWRLQVCCKSFLKNVFVCAACMIRWNLQILARIPRFKYFMFACIHTHNHAYIYLILKVRALQSYIHAKVSKSGYYESTKYRMIKKQPFSLSAAHDLGMNTLTTSLAQVEEKNIIIIVQIYIFHVVVV